MYQINRNKIIDLNQIASENALLNLHSDALKEEAVLAAEREDLRNQLTNVENKYLTVIANMKVVSLIYLILNHI